MTKSSNTMAIKYRKVWRRITKHTSRSTFTTKMRPGMRLLNKFHRICHHSAARVPPKRVARANKYIHAFHAEWQKVIKQCESATAFTLGKKEHYMLNHNVEHMDLCGVPAGYGNERSITRC